MRTLESIGKPSFPSLLQVMGKLMFVVLTWASMLACSGSDELLDDIDDPSKVPLDKPLRVLVLGNSFSVDGLAYLDELARAANINLSQFGIYNGMIKGGGLADWIAVYQKGSSYSFSRASGKLGMKDHGALKEVLSQNWDIVVLLQASDKSYQWENFESALPTMIEIVRSHCTNPDLKLAYAIPWGHTVSSTPREMEGNVACARRLAEEYGIDLVIPVGVAVQNARLTRLNNDTYLTRDNWHLCYGVGRYVAACTWYAALLTPRTGLPVVGNAALHPLSSSERGSKGAVAVDESNRLLCQQCAFQAVCHPYEVSQIPE